MRMGELVTDDEAQTRDLLGYLAQLDIERKQFDKARADLSKRFSITASVHDTAWSILNGIISKTRNPLVAQRAYYEMARLAHAENKPTKPYIAEALKARLIELSQQEAKTVVVQCYGGQIDDSTCPACQALHGKLFPIDKALKELPVPTACTNKECRCSYERS